MLTYPLLNLFLPLILANNMRALHLSTKLSPLRPFINFDFRLPETDLHFQYPCFAGEVTETSEFPTFREYP